ncbi:Acetyltransferase (GNAT) domain-containing protein [Flavobacteriaceae bacterium MAR_2010_188]|nr:Acetyltransferase (GNAT) domain-containing protein [Flavobacteriaceae bacterium MAR_2010_188]
MEFIKTLKLTDSQKREIFDLWNNEYPVNLTFSKFSEFQKYLKSLDNKSYILIADKNQNIKGWYVDFIREKEKWFILILDSDYQSKGLGSKLLNLAKEKETELNGWVIDHNNDLKTNGESYKSPLGFYQKNGFKVNLDVRLELEKISALKISWKV